MFDLAVVGGGPCGLTCGIYGARRALKTIVFEKGLCGGQMLYTTAIENYPGFDKTSGMDLASLMQRQAESFGVEIKSLEVDRIDGEDNVKKLYCGGEVFEAKAVVLATGGDYRKLGAKGEKDFAGRGVSYCGTCDGPFFKDKVVAVVGGGNTAAEDALYLANIASKVFLVHRRDSFRCEQKRVDDMAAAGVEFVLEAQVKEFVGRRVLEKIVLDTPNGEKILEVDGCFIAIGVVPENKIAKDLGVKLDGNGFIEVDASMQTSVPGVFAAGDVTGGVMQVATAVGEGATAGLKAYEFVKQPYWV